MSRMYMKVDFNEVLAKLEKMETKARKKGTKEILEDAGDYMVDEVKSYIHNVSGKLSASIGWKFREKNVIEVGVQQHLAEGRVEEYSAYVEFGTRKMSSRSYMRLPWEANYDVVRQRLIDGFLKLVLAE